MLVGGIMAILVGLVFIVAAVFDTKNYYNRLFYALGIFYIRMGVLLINRILGW